MDIERFARELPTLFDEFPRSEHPRDRRFARVLEEVPGLARENNLALLNLAAACRDAGEAYVELGSFRGTSLISAMLGNEGEFVAIDDFSFRDASREQLEANLRGFGLEGRASILEGDFEEVPGLARENNLALLNLAAGCRDPDEAYVELGSFRGTSLIAAMLDNEGEFVAIDDFSFRDASREQLEANLRRFGLDGPRIVQGDAFEILRGDALGAAPAPSLARVSP